MNQPQYNRKNCHVKLFQAKDLAEHFVNQFATFGKNEPEARPCFAGDRLQNETVTLPLQLVETLQFILQRFRKNRASFDRVERVNSTEPILSGRASAISSGKLAKGDLTYWQALTYLANVLI